MLFQSATRSAASIRETRRTFWQPSFKQEAEFAVEGRVVCQFISNSPNDRRAKSANQTKFRLVEVFSIRVLKHLKEQMRKMGLDWPDCLRTHKACYGIVTSPRIRRSGFKRDRPFLDQDSMRVLFPILLRAKMEQFVSRQEYASPHPTHFARRSALHRSPKPVRLLVAFMADVVRSEQRAHREEFPVNVAEVGFSI